MLCGYVRWNEEEVKMRVQPFGLSIRAKNPRYMIGYLQTLLGLPKPGLIER